VSVGGFRKAEASDCCSLWLESVALMLLSANGKSIKTVIDQHHLSSKVVFQNIYEKTEGALDVYNESRTRQFAWCSTFVTMTTSHVH